jgi:hypothetical protein
VLTLVLCACGSPEQVRTSRPSDPPPPVPAALLSKTSAEGELTSLLQVLSRPDVYDGRRVRLIGFAYVEFEGHGLYLHREDFEHGLSKHALWLDLDFRQPEVAALNGRYVLVDGVFNAKATGHFGMFAGSMQDISRYGPWPARAELKAHD